MLSQANKNSEGSDDFLCLNLIYKYLIYKLCLMLFEINRKICYTERFQLKFYEFV